MKYRNFTNKLMLMVGVTATAVLTSCEQEFYQDEQYRKEIYIAVSYTHLRAHETVLVQLKKK